MPDVDLDEPLPIDPAMQRVLDEGWKELKVLYGSAFCGRCGNAAGLMVNDATDEIACGGCLAWGHPSFEPEGERYRDE